MKIGAKPMVSTLLHLEPGRGGEVMKVIESPKMRQTLGEKGVRLIRHKRIMNDEAYDNQLLRITL